jgi:8-oxo-dGTP pyrophosphatase MutT (NUDIX family)
MGWRDKMAVRGAEGTSGVRMQYGALCWRRVDNTPAAGVEVLLITSRDTGRWIIPKGWPMPGLSPEAAAAQEAWEEAGVAGEMDAVCLGRYGYQKVFTLEAQVPCAVAVYALHVLHLADSFPEALERRRQWFGPADAASLVNEPDLGRLIAGFVPPAAGRLAPIVGE